MGLTNGDVAELTYFFTTPSAGAIAGEILRAQNYEPKGSGTYDPYTDTRLVNLVAIAVRQNRSDETRVRRVIERLLDGMDGRKHFDILRRAFEPLPRLALPVEEFRWPEVARVTTPALERGLELAKKEEHTRLLEGAYEAARTAGCSSIATAMRVFDADRRIFIHGVRVQDSDVRAAARRVLERAMSPRDIPFLELVKGEMHQLVNAAGDAYRAARDAVGATRRSSRAEQRRKSDDLLAETLGKKRRKERNRFMSDPQRADTVETVARALAAMQEAS